MRRDTERKLIFDPQDEDDGEWLSRGKRRRDLTKSGTVQRSGGGVSFSGAPQPSKL